MGLIEMTLCLCLYQSIWLSRTHLDREQCRIEAIGFWLRCGATCQQDRHLERLNWPPMITMRRMRRMRIRMRMMVVLGGKVMMMDGMIGILKSLIGQGRG